MNAFFAYVQCFKKTFYSCISSVNREIQNTLTWHERITGPIGFQSKGAVIEFGNLKLTVFD